MDAIDMKKRLDAGEDPIALAIEKWKDGKDLTSHRNCALCHVYGVEACEKDGKVCPLKVIGEGCHNTKSAFFKYDVKRTAANRKNMIRTLEKAQKWQQEQLYWSTEEKKAPNGMFRLQCRKNGGIILAGGRAKEFEKRFHTPDGNGLKFRKFIESLSEDDEIYLVTKEFIDC